MQSKAHIAAFFGVGALHFSGDWRIDAVIVAISAAGFVFRAFPDRDHDGIPDVDEGLLGGKRGH